MRFALPDAALDLNCPFCQAPLDPGAAGCRGCGSTVAGEASAPEPRTAAKPESKRLPPAGNAHSRALRAKLGGGGEEQPRSRALHALGHLVRPGRVGHPWKSGPAPDRVRTPREEPPRRFLTRVLGRVPSWVVSGVVHAVMLVILALITYSVAKAPPEVVFVKMAEPPPPTKQLPELPELGNTDLVNDLVKEVPAPVIPTELLDNPETADEASSTSVRTAEKVTVAPGATKYGWRGHGGRRYAAATGGGTWGSEQAVDRGLRWLSRNQQDGGWWGYHEDIWTNRLPVQKSMRVGLTGLACLAFLGAGNIPERGKYRTTVERGLEFLITIQDDDGAITDGGRHHAYHHSIATLALCEAVAMGAGERYRAAADRAVRHLIWAQGEDGGWRYHPRSIRGDSSSTGWGLMALAAARAGDVRKPQVEKALRRAHIFFETLTNERGLVLYTADSNKVPHDNALTAVGLLCKYLGGTDHSHPLMAKAASHVVEDKPRWPDPQLKADKQRQAKEIFTKENPVNFYRWYYTSIGLIHRNDENWKAWNPRCRNLLVNMQRRGEREVDGSWDPLGVWCPSAGRVYSTAMSVLTLEVYYRAAPSFLEVPKDELETLDPLTPFYGQALIERAMDAVAEARTVMRTASPRAASAVATAEQALERFRTWATNWLNNPAPEASLEVKAWLRLATRAEGEMALGRGDRARALELLVPALIRDPDGPGASDLRRMVAKALLEQAKSVRDDGDETRARGIEQQAVRLIEDMLSRREIEAGTKERTMRLLVADIHARAGQLHKAAEAYEGALRTASGDDAEQLRRRLALVYMKLEEWKKALEMMGVLGDQAAGPVDPAKAAKAGAALAKKIGEAGQPRQAAEIYRAVLDRFGNDPVVGDMKHLLQRGLAESWAAAGEWNRAADAWLVMVDGGWGATAELKCAEALVRADRGEEALTLTAKLQGELPAFTDMWWEARCIYAEALLGTRQRAQARELVENTKLLYPQLGGPALKKRFEAVLRKAGSAKRKK